MSWLQLREWLGINWNADVKVLDYACGGGVMSRVLAPYASKLVGIDISENMIAEYNKFATIQNLPPHIMHAYHGTLIDPADPNPLQFSSPEFSDFDLAMASMALHHFADPAYSLQKLAERVKSGGVLLVVDNTDKAGGLAHKHAMEGTISKSGFTREETKEMFEKPHSVVLRRLQ
ncbi:S-adenosyl-L-methionine-dependent methyltransferase [Kalaharituber pfeilii]|nr:S-adenosyl-L-methionine-dependent methyltransferase [Kalaharituber pfeilii]